MSEEKIYNIPADILRMQKAASYSEESLRGIHFTETHTYATDSKIGVIRKNLSDEKLPTDRTFLFQNIPDRTGNIIFKETGNLLLDVQGNGGNARKVVGAFPNMNVCLPDDIEFHNIISLNIKLLLKLSKTINDEGEDSILIAIPKDETDPYLVCNSDATAIKPTKLGLFMGCRIDTKNEVIRENFKKLLEEAKK